MSCNSYGLIIFNPLEDAILMVRAKRTYSADCLIAGQKWYDPSQLTKAAFAKIFADGLSLLEKRKFLEDFEDPNHTMFRDCLQSCYSNKLRDMPSDAARADFVNSSLDVYLQTMTLLKSSITKSLESKIDGALPWSFPKGHMSKSDNKSPCSERQRNINVAVRETQEETCVTQDMISIPAHIQPFNIEYTDMSIRYKFQLYYATPEPNFAFAMGHDRNQTDEISEIAWLTRDELGQKPLCKVTREQVYDRFNAIVQHYHTQSTVVLNHATSSRISRVSAPMSRLSLSPQRPGRYIRSNSAPAVSSAACASGTSSTSSAPSSPSVPSAPRTVPPPTPKTSKF